MHRFLRSIGFGSYQRKKDIEKLLDELARTAASRRQIQIEPDTNLCEIRAEVAPDMGIVIAGETDENGTFHREYYYPYLISNDISSSSECSIQRHTEKETYAGLLDENRVGISLIFYLSNGFDYRDLLQNYKIRVSSVCLTGLSDEGKILMPLHKTMKQIEMAKVAAQDRSSLMEAARNGDEDAMETLTIEDIDMYSQISRRVMKEDIYSIVDSCFMPCGIECDQYSVIGEITHIEEKTNRITNELVYDLTINCNDMIFHVCIARKDLLGEPTIGRRFKGQIWMQGVAIFSDQA